MDADAFAYFALSLVWGAAVARWPLPDGGLIAPIDLGLYEEPIRRFLMGEMPFPPEIAVMVRACTDEESRTAWYDPTPVHGLPYKAFGFLIRGVYFRVFMASDLPEDIKTYSCASPFKAMYLMNCERETNATFGRMSGTPVSKA